MNDTERNRDLIRQAFAEPAPGGTTFFDILDDEVEWTIAGSGPSARTFHSRLALLEGGYGPIRDRFASPMKPDVQACMPITTRSLSDGTG